jgi:hypothetical protein
MNSISRRAGGPGSPQRRWPPAADGAVGTGQEPGQYYPKHGLLGCSRVKLYNYIELHPELQESSGYEVHVTGSLLRLRGMAILPLATNLTCHQMVYGLWTLLTRCDGIRAPTSAMTSCSTLCTTWL